MTETVPVFDTPAPPVLTHTSRPVSIEARQWDGTAENATNLINWGLSYGQSIIYTCVDDEACAGGQHVLRIPTLEGTMTAEPGAWIIRGTEDEFYPCKDSVFQAKYAAIPTPTAEEDQRVKHRLLSTDHADIWAEEFCRLYPGVDEDTLTGWFANAIETAKNITRAYRG